MRACTYAAPNALTVGERDAPSTGSGGARDDDQLLLVKVEAAGINPTDIKHLMQGMLPYSGIRATATAPVGFGCEGSGTVVKVPDNIRAADSFQVGDSVYFLVDRMRGSHKAQGALSEYLVLNPKHVAKVPASLTMERAAATPLALLTAFQALRMEGYAKKRCGVGKKILITGASGGVGHFAVQLAKNVYEFETVVGVCSTPNVDFVKSLGADQVIDYKKKDFVDVYPAQTFDVGMDLVGGDPICWPCGCCASSNPMGRTIRKVRRVTKGAGARGGGGSLVGLVTGSSFDGPCGTVCGICCSCLPGMCSYKLSSSCCCCCCRGPTYSSYFLPIGKHIDRTHDDLNTLSVWIDEGLVVTEVTLAVDMADVQVGISRMEQPYLAFVPTTDGAAEAAAKEQSEEEGVSTPPLQHHRGKVVVRVGGGSSSSLSSSSSSSSSSAAV